MLLCRSLVNQAVQSLRQRVIAIGCHAIGREHPRRSLTTRIMLIFLAYHARRIAHSSGARRHLFDDHGIGTDLGAVTHCETTQNLRTSPDDHTATERRMTLGAFAQRSAA